MSTTDWPQPEGDWRQPTGGIPPGGGPPGARRWPTMVKLIIALALLASLSWVLILIAQYCETRRPLSQLPGVPAPVAGLFGPTAEYRGSLDGVQRPLGVALTGGHIFVTESAGERLVRVFDRSGEEIASFAPPETNISSRVPLYIAVSPKGDIYFSDRRGGAIFIFSADGQFQGTFQPQSVPAEDWHPMGLAFDKRGNLYVTDVTAGKHRVMVFSPTGALKLQFGSEGSEEGQFWFPNGIAVDGRGRIFVADGTNGRLQAFDARGNLLFVIPRGYARGDLAMPRGVAVDDDGRLFVVDTSAHIVKVYDVSGDRPRFVYDIGEPGTQEGRFRFPNGIAIQGNRVYVTDRENGRVQVWSY